MTVEQVVRQDGDDLYISLVERPSGRVLGGKVWVGAGKYVRPHQAPQGYVQILIPLRAAMNVTKVDFPRA